MEDQGTVPEDAIARAVLGNWLFERLPPWIVDTLSTEQKEAIHQAVTDPSWQRHVVNIRISLPFFRRRYYVTVVGGEEQRTAERRAHERNRYPLRTISNIFFFLGLATVFYAVALVVLAFYTTIVEI